MLMVVSPSKTLDMDTPAKVADYTLPDMLGESETLVGLLRKYTPKRLSSLMDISDKLAALNVQRYKEFETPFTPENAKQAMFAFRGDVYDGLDADSFTKKEIGFAQEHLRMLSGLYGLLRPLDLMQAYRLEMGIRLKNPRGKDLYGFWGGRITQAINEAQAGHKHKLLINLASEEYFGAVRPELLEGELLTIVFKENHKGTPKVIALFAKRARGAMARYIIRERISNPKDIKDFSEDGYAFRAELSEPGRFVFLRG